MFHDYPIDVRWRALQGLLDVLHRGIVSMISITWLVAGYRWNCVAPTLSTSKGQSMSILYYQKRTGRDGKMHYLNYKQDLSDMVIVLDESSIARQRIWSHIHFPYHPNWQLGKTGWIGFYIEGNVNSNLASLYCSHNFTIWSCALRFSLG